MNPATATTMDVTALQSGLNAWAYTGIGVFALITIAALIYLFRSDGNSTELAKVIAMIFVGSIAALTLIVIGGHIHHNKNYETINDAFGTHFSDDTAGYAVSVAKGSLDGYTFVAANPDGRPTKYTFYRTDTTLHLTETPAK